MKKLLVATLALAMTACSYMNVTTKQCKVTDKESVNSSNTHQYRLYTTCGTLVVEDQLARLNFSSADIYGNIVVGKTYNIVTSGYRIPFLSMFPSVVEIK